MKPTAAQHLARRHLLLKSFTAPLLHVAELEFVAIEDRLWDGSESNESTYASTYDRTDPTQVCKGSLPILVDPRVGATRDNAL